MCVLAEVGDGVGGGNGGDGGQVGISCPCWGVWGCYWGGEEEEEALGL